MNISVVSLLKKKKQGYVYNTNMRNTEGDTAVDLTNIKKIYNFTAINLKIQMDWAFPRKSTITKTETRTRTS